MLHRSGRAHARAGHRREHGMVSKTEFRNATLLMTQPDALKKNEPLKWSTGSGTDVWAMFCACIAGNLEAVKQLLEKNPALVRCHYNYRKPLYFAVRENRIEVVAFLLERDPD